MKHKLFSLFLALVASCAILNAEMYSGSCGVEGDNLTWELDSESGVLTISGTGAMGHYSSSQYPWYSYNQIIQSLVIEEGVTDVWEWAFAYTTNLRSVSLPTSLTRIERNAFANQRYLSTIHIPENVSYIGMSAFELCRALSAFSVAQENGYFSTKDDVLFNKDQSTLIAYPLKKDGSTYSVPAGVDSIGRESFYGSTLLQHIYLPDGVKYIGPQAFRECSLLEEMTIPASANLVNSGAFSGCDKMSSLIVEEGNTTYDSRNNCNAIIQTKTNTLIAGINNTVIPSDVVKIAEDAFFHRTGMTEMVIPNGVTSIEKRGFAECSNLVSIHIPSSVTFIDGWAFSQCRLDTVILPASITAIGNCVFQRCNLRYFVNYAQTPQTVTKLSFNNCDLSDCTLYVPANSIDLYKVADGWKDFGYIKAIDGTESCILASGTCGAQGDNLTWKLSCDSVLTIKGTGAMADFKYPNYSPWYTYPSLIKSAILSEDITYIGKFAFYKCTSLTSITIPNSVTSVGNSAFSGCSGLTSVTIPNSVTTIGNNAFDKCTGLTTIAIPYSVTSVGSSAFYKCTGLTSITVDAANPNYCDVDGVLFNKDKTILIRYPIAKSAIEYTIPNSVTTIGFMAFNDCGLSSVIIPGSVTTIKGEAFYSCRGLTSITIPDELISIESEAFINCESLTSLTIPNAAIECYDPPFEGCTNLETLNLGDGAKFKSSEEDYIIIDGLGLHFNGHEEGIKNININPNNPYYSSIDGVVYDKTQTMILSFPSRRDDNSYVIPNSVTKISDCAFLACTGLTSVAIPNSVTSLGVSAFAGCSGLTALTCEAITPPTCGTNVFYRVDKSIPLYVPAESIDAYKAADLWKDFKNILPVKCLVASGTCGAQGDNLTWEISCDSVLTISGTGEMKDFTNPDDSPWRLYFYKFKSAVINEGVTSIGDYAFSLCTILTSIEIPNSVTRIGSQAFADCSDLTSVVIPNGVSEIREGTFARCSGLISVTLPNGVLSIGLGSFTECSHLTSFEIPNSVTEIGENAFHGCSSLTSITIPNNVTSIGDYAFQGCSGLTSLTVGKELTSMGSTAFEGCNNLTYVNITDLAAWCKINFRSYGACNPLWLSKNLYLNGELVTDLVIPDGVTSISTCAFYGCSGLTSVTIPNSVTSIGKYVFYQCSGLTSVTIPNSVTEIGEYTFYGCTNLPVFDNIRYADTYLASVADKSLSAYSIKDGTKWIGTRAFSDCASLTSIEIPNSVTTLGEEAFSGCMSLTSVSIPNSVTRIGEIAFGMCSNLTSITIPNSVTSIGNVAFDACTGLTSITCEALTLPTLGNKVFKNVDKSIPLYVPYECIDLYKTADQWKDFTNILPIPGTEPVYYKLTLEVNDDMMGSVSGAGRYLEGEEVMLEAIANETYRFAGWYNEKDELLSNQWNYTLSLNSDRTLKAVFEPIPMSSELAMIYVQGQAVEHFVSDNFNYTFRYPAHTPESALPTSSDITFDKGDEYQTVVVSQSGSTIIVNVTSGRGMTKAYVLNFVVEVPNQFTVTALSSNDEWGYVEGSGSYDENSEVSITATPNEGYQFYNWNNSITENPHSFVLTQDTSFLANFLPNKTEDIVTAIGSNSILFEWERKPFAFGYWLYVYLDFSHTVWLCRVKFVGLWPLVLPVDFEWGPGYGPSYVAKVGEESEDVRRMMRARKTDDNVISYTLENLASSTEHFFTIEAFDEQEKVVDAQAGACKTKPQIPTAVENMESEAVTPIKILLNGQFYILRGDKVYTIDGKSLKQ